MGACKGGAGSNRAMHMAALSHGCAGLHRRPVDVPLHCCSCLVQLPLEALMYTPSLLLQPVYPPRLRSVVLAQAVSFAMHRLAYLAVAVQALAVAVHAGTAAAAAASLLL